MLLGCQYGQIQILHIDIGQVNPSFCSFWRPVSAWMLLAARLLTRWRSELRIARKKRRISCPQKCFILQTPGTGRRVVASYFQVILDISRPICRFSTSATMFLWCVSRPWMIQVRAAHIFEPTSYATNLLPGLAVDRCGHPNPRHPNGHVETQPFTKLKGCFIVNVWNV